MKLEETIQELCNEESNELKLQLEQKDAKLENKEKELENILVTIESTGRSE